MCAEREDRARTGEQELPESESAKSAYWTTEPDGCPPAAAAAVDKTPVLADASRVRASSASEGRGSAAWASAKRARGSEEEVEAEAAAKRLRRRRW